MRKQFGVLSTLDDLSFFQDDDFIRMLDGGETCAITSAVRFSISRVIAS